ncbi:DNA gyrase subunit A, chloroplastic/mitochondrial-like isoform X2 [Panicum virgatum]|uniref:DNA gyrase subunit A, chloroplastic/mitochondrial-like isoform X2 n=1 Tax=Panicum virgatum TaxID=38727 RepID=UPI0019D55FA6|nr:DNA gyrase subunit A, chloroplastic/mitochondrial-like isoform X2 [Panicum virgatum]
MRYTECRLDSLAEAMFLTDLELNTVDFVPNFDYSQKEPSLLPTRVSSLLLNGYSGIAVGMATNIPHNMGELVDALSVIIQNPEATGFALSKHVQNLRVSSAKKDHHADAEVETGNLEGDDAAPDHERCR